MSIRDVCLMDKGTRIDFVGIILNIGRSISFKTKRGTPSLRINLQLGDTNLNSINVGIWGATIVNDIENRLVRMGWNFDKAHPIIVVI